MMSCQRRSLPCTIAASLLLVLLMSSCSGSETRSGGTLWLSLTDAPAPEFQAMYVTIAEVQVHRADAPEDDWTTAMTPHATFNLLELVGGSFDPVGSGVLDSGTYNGMRLILGDVPDREFNILGHAHPHANYLISHTGQELVLTVPAGYRTGIRIPHAFVIEQGSTTELLVDFDAMRSVVRAGASGNWLLKPTLKVIDTMEQAGLSGSVSDQDGAALPGVMVSVQVHDPSSATASGRICMTAATLTDDRGTYLVHAEPGTRSDPRTYLLVASADGFSTACRRMGVSYAMHHPADFSLTPAAMGTITCTLRLPSDPAGETAVIEFRQTVPCDASPQIIVKTMNYAGSGSYQVHLPTGTYTVVAAYAGQERVREAVQTGAAVTLSF